MIKTRTDGDFAGVIDIYENLRQSLSSLACFLKTQTFMINHLFDRLCKRFDIDSNGFSQEKSSKRDKVNIVHSRSHTVA